MTDVATFGASNLPNVSIFSAISVHQVVFDVGASSYNITSNPVLLAQFTLAGIGVTNVSGVAQNFVAATGAAGPQGRIFLNPTATKAGSLTTYTNRGSISGGTDGGAILFSGEATGGSATFHNEGGAAGGAKGGVLQFFGSSRAGDSTIINDGGTVNGASGDGQSSFPPCQPGTPPSSLMAPITGLAAGR